jgi:hypothetical protein
VRAMKTGMFPRGSIMVKIDTKVTTRNVQISAINYPVFENSARCRERTEAVWLAPL